MTVLIATSVVFVVLIGCGLGVSSWKLIEASESESRASSASSTNGEETHVYEYDDSLYWSIMGGQCAQRSFQMSQGQGSAEGLDPGPKILPCTHNFSFPPWGHPLGV